MVIKRVKQFTSWSFSRWRDFDRCPAYANWKYLEKLSGGGENDAMRRGTEIHKLAEDYTKGLIPRLPKELSLFKAEFQHLRKVKAPAEESWAFDSHWGRCAWNDWNRAWLRVKVDVHYTEDLTLTVIDHKTGKMRPQKEEEYRQQLELTALAGLKYLPEVEFVIPKLFYLDEGIIYPEEPEPVGRLDEKRLTKIWGQRAARMTNATKFPAKPNDGCRWCDFRNSKGGPCKHG